MRILKQKSWTLRPLNAHTHTNEAGTETKTHRHSVRALTKTEKANKRERNILSTIWLYALPQMCIARKSTLNLRFSVWMNFIRDIFMYIVSQSYFFCFEYLSFFLTFTVARRYLHSSHVRLFSSKYDLRLDCSVTSDF